MRSICTLVVLCAALAGCSVNPYTLERAAPGRTVEAVYKCAVGQASRLGYTLSLADKDTGVFKADKQFTPGFGSGNWGHKMRHELAFVVSQQVGADNTKVNVTASRFNDGKQ